MLPQDTAAYVHLDTATYVPWEGASGDGLLLRLVDLKAKPEFPVQEDYRTPPELDPLKVSGLKTAGENLGWLLRKMLRSIVKVDFQFMSWPQTFWNFAILTTAQHHGTDKLPLQHHRR